MPDGRQFLGFLREGGRRLATTLINDLLAYTRAGEVEGTVTTVDNVGGTLEHALSSLAEAIRENDAVCITHDPLLHDGHWRCALATRISKSYQQRAIKYRTEERPRMHVSAAAQGADILILSAGQTASGSILNTRRTSLEYSNGFIATRNMAGLASASLFANAWLNVMADESGSNQRPGKEQPSFSPSHGTPPESAPRRLNLFCWLKITCPDALLVREAIQAEQLEVDVHIVAGR